MDGRQGAGAEVVDLDQHQCFAFRIVYGGNLHIADPRRVELALVAVLRRERAVLVGHENIRVTVGRHTYPLVRLEHFGAIQEVDARRVALQVAGSLQPGMSAHEQARFRAVHTGDPGVGGAGQVAVLILLRVLAQIPDIAVLVLRVKG